MKGILGRKLGMTQIFDPETGGVTAVTAGIAALDAAGTVAAEITGAVATAALATASTTTDGGGSEIEPVCVSLIPVTRHGLRS